MEPTSQLDPSAYQSLLGGASGSLFPESLVTTMIVSFVVLNILGLLFLVFYIMNLVRNWKVQSAIFDIHKDVAELKTALIKTGPVQQPASLSSANDLIAKHDTQSNDTEQS